MLLIRCAACRRKIWRYDKIGPGEVLRCHKTRISKRFIPADTGQRLTCPCGKTIGIDRGTHYKMIQNAFTYSGTKRTS